MTTSSTCPACGRPVVVAPSRAGVTHRLEPAPAKVSPELGVFTTEGGIADLVFRVEPGVQVFTPHRCPLGASEHPRSTRKGSAG